jgi:hypothetical protein
MKCLKEPLSRLVNRQEKVRGAFFEGRFKSVAILDDGALLAVGAYIDLNPVAAGIAEAPETSKYTSIRQRVEHVEAQGQTAQLEAAGHGNAAVRQAHDVAGSQAVAGLEDSLWLCPIADRRRLDSSREGMLEGFSLEATCFWSITRGGCFATGRPRSRRNWRESSIGWGAVQRAGGLAWRSCAQVACSVGSLPRVERSCGRRPRG